MKKKTALESKYEEQLVSDIYSIQTTNSCWLDRGGGWTREGQGLAREEVGRQKREIKGLCGFCFSRIII